MLALRIMQGIAKPLAEHVLDLKHSPLSKQAMKRQTLRLWAEYSLGTINKIIDMKSGRATRAGGNGVHQAFNSHSQRHS